MELEALRPAEKALTKHLPLSISKIVEDYTGWVLPKATVWKHCHGGCTANTSKHKLELSEQGTFCFTSGWVSRAGQDGHELTVATGTYACDYAGNAVLWEAKRTTRSPWKGDEDADSSVAREWSVRFYERGLQAALLPIGNIMFY